MAFEDWETRPDGTVKICPVAAWDSFIPFGMMCGLRLHYAETEEDLRSGRFGRVPLVFTVAQARELASVLNELADKAETPPSGENSH